MFYVSLCTKEQLQLHQHSVGSNHDRLDINLLDCIYVSYKALLQIHLTLCRCQPMTDLALE